MRLSAQFRIRLASASLAFVLALVAACSSPTEPVIEEPPTPTPVPISPTVENLTGTWINSMSTELSGVVSYMNVAYQFRADGSYLVSAFTGNMATSNVEYLEAQGRCELANMSLAFLTSGERHSSQPFSDDSGWSPTAMKQSMSACLYQGKLFLGPFSAQGASDGVLGDWRSQSRLETGGTTNNYCTRIQISADHAIIETIYIGFDEATQTAQSQLVLTGTWAAEADGSISARFTSIDPQYSPENDDGNLKAASVRFARIGNFLVQGTQNAWDGKGFTKQ